MRIGGISIILILGIVNFALLCFQLASGLRWIKPAFGIHRKTGIALVIVASIHGLLAFFTAS